MKLPWHSPVSWLPSYFTLNNTTPISCFHVWPWKQSSQRVNFPFLSYVIKRKLMMQTQDTLKLLSYRSIKIILFIWSMNVDSKILILFFSSYFVFYLVLALLFTLIISFFSIPNSVPTSTLACITPWCHQNFISDTSCPHFYKII